MPKIHFITFYSQGAPYDNGLDLSATENNVRTKIQDYVDTFTAYHPKDFANDPEFAWSIQDWSNIDHKYARHPDGWWSPLFNKYIDINTGCDKTGFFAWKAACIIKKMREILEVKSNIKFHHLNSHTNKEDMHSLNNAIVDKMAGDVLLEFRGK